MLFYKWVLLLHCFREHATEIVVSNHANGNAVIHTAVIIPVMPTRLTIVTYTIHIVSLINVSLFAANLIEIMRQSAPRCECSCMGFNILSGLCIKVNCLLTFLPTKFYLLFVTCQYWCRHTKKSIMRILSVFMLKA